MKKLSRADAYGLFSFPCWAFALRGIRAGSPLQAELSFRRQDQQKRISASRESLFKRREIHAAVTGFTTCLPRELPSHKLRSDLISLGNEGFDNDSTLHRIILLASSFPFSTRREFLKG